MVILIDAGNTAIKVAPLVDDIIGDVTVFSHSDFPIKILEYLRSKPSVKGIALCSVVDLPEKCLVHLNEIAPIFHVNTLIKLPFTNHYKGNTLGADRIALVAGAMLFPEKNRLIIDIGTCITYDVVTINNEYLGGAIAPGLTLRYKSLNDYTDRLPLLSPAPIDKPLGSTTADSIHSGVLGGTAHEIDGFISEVSEQYKNLVTLITGGSSEVLTKRLKNRFFAPPNLVLHGIKILYEINHSN